MSLVLNCVQDYAKKEVQTSTVKFLTVPVGLSKIPSFPPSRHWYRLLLPREQLRVMVSSKVSALELLGSGTW